ncbi:MAG: YifB family Mg chelatase-like AAA ATPase [Candidatus Omnitrophota bacterium]
MLAKVISNTVLGIEAKEVVVEVYVSGGMPGFAIVGLPDPAVRESINRVKAAIRNCKFQFPSRKITVNLAPADIKKEGPCFDLPIALGILAASEQITQGLLAEKVFCGELSLDGVLRPIMGSLSRAMALRGTACNKLFLPGQNAAEAAVVTDIDVFALHNLAQAVSYLNHEIEIAPVKVNMKDVWRGREDYEFDFADVKGQFHIKRGLEVAASGGHNVLLIGSPGAGKTMLARCMPGILPAMSAQEALETSRIHSVAGLIDSGRSLIAQRPFRAPHHSISDMALIGGGTHPRPGEISLAHNGVLFLDELPEFRRNVLEALRQPLEAGMMTVSRVASSVTYPARFMLISACNPCPCGFFLDNSQKCHCAPYQIQRYLSKISGPLLDRIDIHLEVPRLNYEEMTSVNKAESSAEIRKRVDTVRAMQRKRLEKFHCRCNAHMGARLTEKTCLLTKPAQDMLKMAILDLGLSARAYHKVLKLARTIADLAESELIGPEHISEAISYRCLDRNLWAL